MKQCSLCKYWTSAAADGVLDVDDEDFPRAAGFGTCRRYPPAYSPVAMHERGDPSDYFSQPKTAAHDVCGEFSSYLEG